MCSDLREKLDRLVYSGFDRCKPTALWDSIQPKRSCRVFCPAGGAPDGAKRAARQTIGLCPKKPLGS
jgi:hypothetical protein